MGGNRKEKEKEKTAKARLLRGLLLHANGVRGRMQSSVITRDKLAIHERAVR
jgi:hypothetical protein